MTPSQEKKLVDDVALKLHIYDTGITSGYGWSVMEGWEREMFRNRAMDFINLIRSRYELVEKKEVGK